MQEWRRLTERIGFWVDLDDAYVTYHQSYVESVWWSLKNLFDRGLLYQGHKIVWWWAQGGTALSAGEVGQGYRQVADPSVYVKFPLLHSHGELTNRYLLVWTTTPWTLPSNQFVAVHPDLDYEEWRDIHDNTTIFVASALAEKFVSNLAKHEMHWSTESQEGNSLAIAIYRHSIRITGCSETRKVPERISANNILPGESFLRTLLQLRVEPESFISRRRLAKTTMKFSPNSSSIRDDEGPTLINCVGPDGKFTDEAPDIAAAVGSRTATRTSSAI